jgi:hypothetical protein
MHAEVVAALMTTMPLGLTQLMDRPFLVAEKQVARVQEEEAHKSLMVPAAASTEQVVQTIMAMVAAEQTQSHQLQVKVDRES